MLKRLSDLLQDKAPTPNKFTLAMGELIRIARTEEGLSQEELAKKVYRRRATISNLEQGKSQADAITLALMAAALKKPIIYFYPKFITKELEAESLDPLEQELLIHFRRIWNPELYRVAINQVKALADFSTQEDIEKFRKEREQEKSETTK